MYLILYVRINLREFITGLFIESGHHRFSKLLLPTMDASTPTSATDAAKALSRFVIRVHSRPNIALRVSYSESLWDTEFDDPNQFKAKRSCCDPFHHLCYQFSQQRS